MEAMRTVYKSTIFIVLRRIEDLENQGISPSRISFKEKNALMVDLLSATIPWENDLLPAMHRERMCAKIMRYFTRYSPRWSEIIIRFLQDQIGQKGIERWIEDNAPMWVVYSDADGVFQVSTTAIPAGKIVCVYQMFIPVRDGSSFCSEN